MGKRLALGALLMAGGLAAAALVWLGYDQPSFRDDPAQLARGARLYSERCASCHGAQLEGQPNWQEPLPNGRMPAPPHDASGHTWHHSDAEQFAITKNGMAAVVPGYESDMLAFRGTLSDEEIWAVLAFINSTWPKTEREYQRARNRPRA